MLKTLRVTSLVTVILAAIGVITIIAMGLKGDPEIKAYLARPGIVAELRGHVGQNSAEEGKSSPLVALAQKAALRFDPPVPVVKDKPKPLPDTIRAKPKTVSIPQPKVQIDTKFDLLATVFSKTAPGKSLALLKTSSNKQEWFREGEKAGHLEIQEIRDGSVVFSQEGGKTQEKFVPVKPVTQSFLKGDRPVSAAGVGDVPVSVQTQTLNIKPELTSGTQTTPTLKTTSSGKIHMTRPRSDVSERIQRARSAPRTPPRTEQKRDINETVSKIQEIMSNQDESVSGEEQKEQNEMWMELLEKLNAEKKQIDSTAEAEKSSEKDNR